MTTASTTPKYRELTRRSVLHEGMRVAVKNHPKVIHLGRVVQVHGDGAHVEYDYQPGVRHLHLSDNMVELLEGNPFMAPQDGPVRR